LSFVLFLVIAGGVLLAPAGGLAQTTRKSPKPIKPSTKPAVQAYTVIQVGDECKVILTSDLAAEKKKVADQYKDDMKQWQKDKKDDPNAPKPAKLVVKVIKGGFKDKAEADKRCADEQEKVDKKKEAKSGAGTGTGTDKKAGG
jgi:hypothetical protein